MPWIPGQAMDDEKWEKRDGLELGMTGIGGWE